MDERKTRENKEEMKMKKGNAILMLAVSMLIASCETEPNEAIKRGGSTGYTIVQEPAFPGCEDEYDPIEEICDGRDNDCDGRTDENLTRPCEALCGRSIQECRDGEWTTCTADKPVPEECNGMDDDCDGMTDENLIAHCVNKCDNLGITHCENGAWSYCEPDCESADDGTEEPAHQPEEPEQQEGAAEPEGVPTPEGAPAEDPPDEMPEEFPPQEPPDEMPEDPSPDEPPPEDPPDEPPPEDPPPQENPPPQEEEPEPEPEPDPDPQPPPQQPAVLDAPVLSSPPDNYIVEAPTGIQASAFMRWRAPANAVEYEYVIRFGGIHESGSMIETGRTQQSFMRFTRPPNFYGQQFLWKVRAWSVEGIASEWSRPQTFFFSYPIGYVVECTGPDCPFTGAWYQVSRDTYDTGTLGIPPLLILDYVSAQCSRGRVVSPVTFEEMSGYYRSARFNGCP